MNDSKLVLLHSVNAGVSVSFGGYCFFIDALHNEKAGTYSTMTPEMVSAFLSSSPAPDLLTCTHRHPDHYSESLSSLAADKYPGMKFVFPEEPCLLQFPGFSIEFIEMRHLGDAGTVPGNYCIVIRCAGKTLFFSGDCDPKDEDGVKRITGLNPDFSLLSFPWVTLFTGRKAVEALNPQHIAVAHLPLEKDDEFGYRDAARKCIEKYYPDAVMLQRFLQSAEFTI